MYVRGFEGQTNKLNLRRLLQGSCCVIQKSQVDFISQSERKTDVFRSPKLFLFWCCPLFEPLVLLFKSLSPQRYPIPQRLVTELVDADLLFETWTSSPIARPFRGGTRPDGNLEAGQRGGAGRLAGLAGPGWAGHRLPNCGNRRSSAPFFLCNWVLHTSEVVQAGFVCCTRPACGRCERRGVFFTGHSPRRCNVKKKKDIRCTAFRGRDPGGGVPFEALVLSTRPRLFSSPQPRGMAHSTCFLPISFLLFVSSAL